MLLILTYNKYACVMTGNEVKSAQIDNTWWNLGK